MKLTPALYVRQWLTKFHPPLPQTPRESQQLLRMLEGSFRKHLDEVHPPPSQRQTANVSQHEIPLTSLESSSTATYHYFNTVLSNPLLSKPGAIAKARAPLTTTAVNTFLKALQGGTVGLALLRRCTKEYLQGKKNGEIVAEKDQLADKLASWIYTSTPAERGLFLGTSDVLRLGVQVAGVDAQEAVAWDWLRMLYERQLECGTTVHKDSLKDVKWLIVEDELVSRIMQLSIQRGALSDAAQQFVEACQYRLSSGRAAARAKDVIQDLAYVPMEDSWKRLAASIIFHRGHHGISKDLYDRVVTYGLSWSLAPAFNVATVSIYHPVSPTASFLYQHLQSAESASHFLNGQAQTGKRSRKAMLTMILDGAQLSLEKGSKRQAYFLLNFAHTHYTEFLPPMTSKPIPNLDSQIRQAQDEIHAHSYSFAWT